MRLNFLLLLSGRECDCKTAQGVVWIRQRLNTGICWPEERGSWGEWEMGRTDYLPLVPVNWSCFSSVVGTALSQPWALLGLIWKASKRFPPLDKSSKCSCLYFQKDNWQMTKYVKSFKHWTLSFCCCLSSRCTCGHWWHRHMMANTHRYISLQERDSLLLCSW